MVRSESNDYDVMQKSASENVKRNKNRGDSAEWESEKS